jgi:hypothetical protein
MKPVRSMAMVAIENALAPPPEGSTAVKRCMVLSVGFRTEYSIWGARRCTKASMEEEWKACTTIHGHNVEWTF